MESKYKLVKNELEELISKGQLLYHSMLKSQGKLSQEIIEKYENHNITLPNFIIEYDTWYSEALLVVKQIIPDRLDDFIKQYKNEKRKNITSTTYGISDYLLAVEVTRGVYDIVANQASAIPKMQNQCSILASSAKRFDSVLFDIQEVIQADIYDSELTAAKDLVIKGFMRGGGAITGVVLEKHLGHVCALHGLKPKKKNPSISDFNQTLKDSNIIDIAMWRFIQHLGDIRNLCDHSKERDPTKDDVLGLVEGVDKVIKTVF